MAKSEEGTPEKRPVGAVAVIGAGIGGMQAALDLADGGFKVYLADAGPAIGGTMAQLDKTFPTNDCAMCIMSPKLVETGRHLNIEILTMAAWGRAGRLHAAPPQEAALRGYEDMHRLRGLRGGLPDPASGPLQCQPFDA
jgi:choline dehydrogenase-like flavoprotein